MITSVNMIVDHAVIYCGAVCIKPYRQDSPMKRHSCWGAGLQEQRNQGEEKDLNPSSPPFPLFYKIPHLFNIGLPFFL